MTRSSVEEYAEELSENLDVRNPQMGRKKPVEGPLEILDEYRAEYCEDTTYQKTKTGKAINHILLKQADHAKINGKIESPNLLYNLSTWLQSEIIPQTRPGLNALKDYQKPLEKAYARDNLYCHAMRALGTHQGKLPETDLWDHMLDQDKVVYFQTATHGLLQIDPQYSLERLTIMEDSAKRARSSKLFDVFLLRLIGRNPKAKWPEVAQDYLDWFGEDIEIYKKIKLFAGEPTTKRIPKYKLEVKIVQV